jgi:hypothetical protein
MSFLEGSAPALPKISAHHEMRPPVFQPALAGFVFVATDLKTGRGTRGGMNWEGKAPAEPKRQRVANGE